MIHTTSSVSQRETESAAQPQAADWPAPRRWVWASLSQKTGVGAMIPKASRSAHAHDGCGMQH